jgi:hypothetical protein
MLLEIVVKWMYIFNFKKSLSIVSWIFGLSHKYKIITTIMIRRVLSVVGNSVVTMSRQPKWASMSRRYLMTGLTNRYQFTSTSGPSQTALLE